MIRACRSAQRGVVLFIALIVLVAMTLAGIALMRNVDTGTVIAGNLAFRQTATHVADLGTEAARNWLTGTGLSLNEDQIANAYYATWRDDSHDLLGNNSAVADFNWDSNGLSVSGTPTGYTVRYVIHRLCATAGAPSAITGCVKTTGAASSASASTKGAASYGVIALEVATLAIYRVTVRVVGPRNTISYVQATMY